jgi:hypothetical protein
LIHEWPAASQQIALDLPFDLAHDGGIRLDMEVVVGQCRQRAGSGD